MSNSVGPYGQQPTRLLRPQDLLGKNTGVGCRFLLQYVCVCVCVCVCVYIYIYTLTNILGDRMVKKLKFTEDKLTIGHTLCRYIHYFLIL